MVDTLKHGAESSLSNLFDYFKPVSDLITHLQPIVTFRVVETIVDEPFELRWLVLVL